MDTLSFLRLVWPQRGLYLLSRPASFTKDGEVVTYHKHTCYQTIEEAAGAALELSRHQGVNVFYAMSSVHNDYTGMTKADRDAAGLKIRGGDNVAFAKAFWIDLDVGAEDGKYASQAEAAASLKQFVKSLGMPKPYVTSSGGGLHVYWPMTEEVDAVTWREHASILKALCSATGTKADPSRTADMASVLRPVGTFNWKTGAPRPVELVLTGEVTQTQALLLHLQSLRKQYALHIPQVMQEQPNPLGAVPDYLKSTIPVVNINESAAEGAGLQPPKASAVVQKCPQLMWQLNNPQAVSEPQWYAMIGCLRFAENGRKGIHKMSAGYAGYSPDAVDNKIIQHENSGTGPTLCSTFEMHNPVLCAGCKYRGHVKTPLQVGRLELEAAPAPVIEVPAASFGETQQLALPPPPWPFKRVKMKNHDACYIVLSSTKQDTDIEHDIVVYEFDIFPTRLIFDQRENALCVVVRLWLPHEGWHERNIPAGDFYDRRSLMRKLAAAGVMVDAGRVEELTQYMIGYLRELQKHARADVVYAQLGWHDSDNAFVLADRVIRADGMQAIEPSANVKNATGWREPRGDLETWKQIVSVFERPRMEGHQFGFGVGFAAPLFRFTNFTGAIVSMVGERGSGKSSAAFCANSIWGHPKLGLVDMKIDTWKSVYNKFGALNSLPITYDEITNMEPEKVSDLAYAITQGQGRQKLQQSGIAQENHGNWSTIMLTTANMSLHGKLALAKVDASAEASRIFEYRVPENTLTKEEADANFIRLQDNFGTAAVPYVQALVQRLDWAKARIQHWIKVIDTAAKVNSSERFWSAVPAAVLTAFEITNEIGLTNADIQRLQLFAVSTINGMRGNVDDIVRTTESLVTDYINENLRSMLIIQGEPEGTTLAQVSVAPTSDKLRIRLERHTGMLFLDRADFRRFCRHQGADAGHIQNDLRRRNILLDNARKVTLGRGTVFQTAQTYCWMLDMNHPALSGSVRAVNVVDAPAGQAGTV